LLVAFNIAFCSGVAVFNATSIAFLISLYFFVIGSNIQALSAVKLYALANPYSAIF
jgi:hypothetical protein